MTRTPVRYDIRELAKLTATVVSVADAALTWLETNVPSPYGAGGTGGASGAPSNPTITRTLSGMPIRAMHTQITERARLAVLALRDLEASILDVPRTADTSTAARQARCTGGEGDWQRPDCTALAVTRDGICDACRQRRDYHRQKAAS